VARIVITSLGTMGDFVPYVALACALKERGHAVTAAVNRAMHPLFRNAGISTATCGPRFGPAEARRVAHAFDGWRKRTRQLEALDRRLNAVPHNRRDLLQICHGADLLIASSLQYAAPDVSRKLGVPWICVSTTPEEFTHIQGEAFYRKPAAAPLILLVSSPFFSRPMKKHYPTVRTTGFWFYDGAAQPGWAKPSVELRRFVRRGPPPLVLLPASIPVSDRVQVVAVHAKAAQRIGRRLIIQHGWTSLPKSGLPRSVRPGSVLFAKHLPHDWLLPKCAALIFHGGMGTLARALRDACPMLVEPYGRDCFYNAQRLVKMGVAAAMDPHRLTVEGLARVLEEKVLTDSTQRKARTWADRVKPENGPLTACQLIERFLRNRVRGAR